MLGIWKFGDKKKNGKILAGWGVHTDMVPFTNTRLTLYHDLYGLSGTKSRFVQQLLIPFFYFFQTQEEAFHGSGRIRRF